MMEKNVNDALLILGDVYYELCVARNNIGILTKHLEEMQTDGEEKVRELEELQLENIELKEALEKFSKKGRSKNV